MLTEKGRTKNKFVLQMDDLHTNTCIPKYSVEKKFMSKCHNNTKYYWFIHISIYHKQQNIQPKVKEEALHENYLYII